jgi:hypothetical protein
MIMPNRIKKIPLEMDILDLSFKENYAMDWE